ncbi:hypothetical protein LCGC14_1392740 [marine sediment metagenome]|uniref:Zinc/iron-chelating domain-containing protein n=1 Tax=marine sediment metagenome TaxID=412755 RepID=A0A0F9JZL8_9ZZZZ
MSNDARNEWGFWLHHGPLGWLELYAYYEGKEQDLVNHFSPMDSMLFFGQLVPVLTEDGYRYQCGYFERDADGLGVCTAYDQRPGMCSEFPYGKPAQFERCSWNVELIDYEVVQGVWV